MAIDMFLKIDGITGDSLDSKHKGEIDILSWSWGMSTPVASRLGSGGGAGKVNMQDISVTKFCDSASNAIMLASANGQHIKTCTLLSRRGAGTQINYVALTLTDVIVTSVSLGGSGGEDRFTENVTLNFSKVKFEYTPQKQDGSADAVKTFGWDLAANQKM